MITLKSSHEIQLMRQAGKITAAARALAGAMVAPGVTTREIDKEVKRFIRSKGAEPSFLGYNGYPASVCISVNDEVIHGIPGHRVLKEGDIVSIDVGAYKDGYHGDCAGTYPCGQISEEARRLIEVTRQSFFEGIRYAREGYRLPDLSGAIQRYVEAKGFSVVREYVGHGIGTRMHEAPEVPNYVEPKAGRPRFLRGMTVAVEPMVNAGRAGVLVMPDGWTVKTADGRLSAHYENSILITDGEPELLTDPEAKAEQIGYGHCAIRHCKSNCRQGCGKALLRPWGGGRFPPAGGRQDQASGEAEAEKAQACGFSGTLRLPDSREDPKRREAGQQ